MMQKKSVLILLIVGLAGIAYGQLNPEPVLFGTGYDGLVPADGATLEAYPESSPDDKVTDVVGVLGKSGISGYWKANLNNLEAELENGDVIIVRLFDGIKQTMRKYIVDLMDGAINITLNLDPAFQDYDDDGITGDNDCDDEDPEIGECDFNASIQIHMGWTMFSLPYNPGGIGNSQELGDAISAIDNVECDVIMTFDGLTQEMIDDILAIADPTFELGQGKAYFIHCNNPAVFNYGGTLW